MVENQINITRLNKYIALSGICTRKEAASLIKQGHVLVNNDKCTEPFYIVQPNDIVQVYGKIIRPIKKCVYLLLNKPKNVGDIITENSKNTTIRQLLKMDDVKDLKQIFPLSFASSGLTVITDDYTLCKKYENSDKASFKSVYEIHLEGEMKNDFLEHMKNTANKTAPFIKSLASISNEKANILGAELSGGSEADLLRFFIDQNLKIIKCDRTFLKGMTKKDLKRGWFRSLTQQEVIFLKHF